MRRQRFATIGLSLAGLLVATAGTPLAAEWSHSVTVNQEVLTTLPAAGSVPALPPHRLPAGSGLETYSWAAPAGGGGATAWGVGTGGEKAAPALIRPGAAPQRILGTGSSQ